MRFLAPLFLTLIFSTSPAFSAKPLPKTERKLMQTGGNETIFDRKNHLTKLRGDAFIYRENEVVRADYIELETQTEKVHAEGRVQYQYGEYFIRADSIDLDLRAKTGTVINGNLTNGQFALRGSRIEQKEPGHFIVNDYDYTTCHDCPNSWEMTGKNGDFTLDGYAVMHDFVFKVKDLSVLYMPFMVLPIKTTRQSGFLFPRFGQNQAYGSFIVAPYYWAINPWSDATVGIGDYSKNGFRFESEARYSLTDRSHGSMNLYWTHDTAVPGLLYRYAGKAAVTQELPFNVEAKLRINEVSDSGYPIIYSDDILGRQEPVLASDLFFTRNDPGLSTFISFRRIRNLLYFSNESIDPKLKDTKEFVKGLDGRTVQEFPRIVVNSNDRFIFGQKFAFGVEGRFNRFTRAAGPFDDFTTTDQKPHHIIREADRLTLIPNVYTTLNPWPWLSLVPSLQYRSSFYNFNGAYSESNNNNLIKGYMLAQAEASLQLERFYKTDDPNVSFKHTVRPTLVYSNIPTIQQPTENGKIAHPFIQQIQEIGASGQYFDNSDIVPLNSTKNLDNYFTPLGNSLTYGLVSQIFKKENLSDGSTRVRRRVEAGLNQTIDLVEAKKPLDRDGSDHRIILSPLFAHAIYQNDNLSAGVDYTYFSYLDHYKDIPGIQLYPIPHRFSTTFGWTIDHAVRQGVLTFDRSVYVNYSFSKITSKVSSLQFGGNFSLNDYVMPKASLGYNLVTGAERRLLNAIASVLFQSPSKCWQFEIGGSYRGDLPETVNAFGLIFNFALNMTGNSLTPLDDSLKK